MSKVQFCRPPVERYLVERLPDGSIAVFDTAADAVHSLNETAALIWDCCLEPVTSNELAEFVVHATGRRDAHIAVSDALERLERAQLLERLPAPSAEGQPRRTALKWMASATAGFVAPMVLTMSLTEQNAYARQAMSPMPTTTQSATTTPEPTTTQGGGGGDNDQPPPTTCPPLGGTAGAMSGGKHCRS